MLKKLLNIDIDKIFIISLKENDEQRKRCLKEFNYFQIPYEKCDFIIVEKHKNPELGCFQSHIKCIIRAKQLKYKNVLIMEDDFEFDKNFDINLYNKLRIPNNFDMIYLGYHMNDGYRHSENLLLLKSALTTHSYIINERLYNYILQIVNIDFRKEFLYDFNERNGLEHLINYKKNTIDIFYSKLIHKRKNSYGLFPMICFQKEGFSHIENKVVNYNKMFIEKSLIFSNKFKYNDPKIFLVNLDKRKDRLDNFQKNFNKYFKNFIKFSAIDGSKLNVNNYMNIFNLKNYTPNKNPYPLHNYNPNILGCSLSHILIWESIKNNKLLNDDDYVIILEDDIYIKDNTDFYFEFKNILNKLKYDSVWDIVFLGFTDYKPISGDEDINEIFIKLSGEKRLNGGGTFSYIIRKNACVKLLNLVLSNRVSQAIDWFLIEQFDKLNCYKLKNDLIYSDIAQISGDSDIQPIQNNLIKKNIKPIQNNLIKKNIKPIQNNLIVDSKNSTNDIIVYKKNNNDNTTDRVNENKNKKLTTHEKYNNSFIDENNKQIFFYNNNKFNFSHDLHINTNINKVYNVTLKNNIEYNIIYCGQDKLTLDIINNNKKCENTLLFCNSDSKDFILDNMIIINYNKFQQLLKYIKYNEIIFVDTDILKLIKIDINKMKIYYNKYNLDKNHIFNKNLIELGMNIYFENLDCKNDFNLLYNINSNKYNILEHNNDIIKNNYNNKKNNIVVYNKNIDLQFLKDIKNSIDPKLKIIIFTNNHLIKDDDFIIYSEKEYYNTDHIYNNKLLLFTENSQDFYWVFNNSKIYNTLLVLSPIFQSYNNKLLTTNKIDNIKKALLEQNYRKIHLNIINLIK